MRKSVLDREQEDRRTGRQGAGRQRDMIIQGGQEETRDAYCPSHVRRYASRSQDPTDPPVVVVVGGGGGGGGGVVVVGITGEQGQPLTSHPQVTPKWTTW